MRKSNLLDLTIKTNHNADSTDVHMLCEMEMKNKPVLFTMEDVECLCPILTRSQGHLEFAGRKTSLKVVTRPRLPVRSVLLTAVRKHLWTDLMSLIQISTQALLLWGPVHIVLLKCTNQEHEVQWFLSTWWDEYSASLMTEKQETGAERFCGVFYSCTSAVSYFLKYRLKTLCTRYVNL